MADIHEFMVSMDLRGDLTDDQVAELRWHLGLGLQPDRFAIITAYPDLVFDDHGEPMDDENGNTLIVDNPRPVHGRVPGAGWRIEGAIFSALVKDDNPYTGNWPDERGRWSLTCRWEIHPDDWHDVGQLFGWLVKHAVPNRFFGYLRWYEDDEPEAMLEIQDGILVMRRNGRVEPFDPAVAPETVAQTR